MYHELGSFETGLNNGCNVGRDGAALPPALIYKGESADLHDSWVEDFLETDEAYFATSSNGWSPNDLGLQWLDKVFNRHTKDKAGNRRRLLLVDGHSSHVNVKFIVEAEKLLGPLCSRSLNFKGAGH